MEPIMRMIEYKNDEMEGIAGEQARDVREVNAEQNARAERYQFGRQEGAVEVWRPGNHEVTEKEKLKY